MNFDEYQKQAKETASYPHHPLPLYLAIGLGGEAGEVQEKIKKLWRSGVLSPSPEEIEGIKMELGDVLWYVSEIARHFGILLSDVAESNLAKLEDREARGVINGKGDDR